MPKSTFALTVVFLFLSFSSCSAPEPDLLESARLETAVAGTLTAVPSGKDAPNLLHEPEFLGTDQPDGDTAPVKSPTPVGILRIVYINEGNVWISEGSDPPRQLSHHGHAERVFLSSDGELAAYVNNDVESDAFELRVVNTDGSDDRLILDQTDFDSLYPLMDARQYLPSQMNFLYGTHRLLFNTQQIYEGPGLKKNDDLLSINLDTGMLELLQVPGRGGDVYPSPDGTMLAIIRETSIGFCDSDGSNLHSEILTFPPVKTYSEYAYYPQPVWAPDSSRFAVMIPSGDPLGSHPTGTIWILARDGSTPIQTAVIDGQSFFPQAFGAPLISPDLSKVAFMRPGIVQNEEQLIIAEKDGSNETIYTTGNLRWGGWSPDSATFVYTSGPSDLRLGTIGKPPQSLGSGKQFRWITNKEFIFIAGDGGHWKLMKGSVGSAVEEIVRLLGDAISYDFIQ